MLRTIEVGEAVLALDIVTDQFELSEGNLIILKISQRDFIYASLKSIGSDLSSNSTGDEGFADLADVEHGRCLYIVPVLLGEGINSTRNDIAV